MSRNYPTQISTNQHNNLQKISKQRSITDLYYLPPRAVPQPSARYWGTAELLLYGAAPALRNAGNVRAVNRGQERKLALKAESSLPAGASSRPARPKARPAAQLFGDVERWLAPPVGRGLGQAIGHGRIEPEHVDAGVGRVVFY